METKKQQWLYTVTFGLLDMDGVIHWSWEKHSIVASSFEEAVKAASQYAKEEVNLFIESVVCDTTTNVL